MHHAVNALATPGINDLFVPNGYPGVFVNGSGGKSLPGVFVFFHLLYCRFGAKIRLKINFDGLRPIKHIATGID
jgi:hypothetical protein